MSTTINSCPDLKEKKGIQLISYSLCKIREDREKKREKMENPWTRMVEEWGRESRMTNIRKEEEIK